MVRIGVSVEGVTEERFIHKCLAPYFMSKGILLIPISLNGNVSIDRIRGELNKLFYNFDYVTTFYDFYGFKKKAEDETKTSLETRILKSVPKNSRGRLIPYIQMYEFEALLFSSPSHIATDLQQADLEQWAIDTLKTFNNDPEKVNDSPHTAPKKRFEAKYPQYREVIHSPLIACNIGIDTLRKNCAGFNEWLNQLERLSISK